VSGTPLPSLRLADTKSSNLGLRGRSQLVTLSLRRRAAPVRILRTRIDPHRATSRGLTVIDQLISTVKPQIVAALSSKLGLSPQAAEQFMGKALPMLQNYMTSGKVDAAALMAAVSGAGGGATDGTSSLLKGFDAGPLAAIVGGDANKAQACIGAIAGPILTHLTNAPNSPELIGQLLGGGDAASKGGLGGLISNFAGGLLGGKK